MAEQTLPNTKPNIHSNAYMGDVLYKLPYDAPLVDTYIFLANNAQQQADTARHICKKVMDDHELFATNVLPSYMGKKETFTPNLIYSTRSLVMSAEAAYQAQCAACEGLLSAAQVAVEERNNISQRLYKVEGEIAILEQESVSLRQSFSLDSHTTVGSDEHNTTEAKRLLATLEATYQRNELKNTLLTRQKETEANVQYLLEVNNSARDQLRQIEITTRRAKNKWTQITELFELTPEQLAKYESKRTTAISTFLGEPNTPAPIIPEKKKIIEQTKKDAEQEESIGAVIWSYVKIVLIAFLIAFLLRAYVFDVTRVKGESMIPTLSNADSLITSKISYSLGDPERGDIVVLHAPDSPGEDYIKRIIGLPNDELKIENGQVYINGVVLKENYLDNVSTDGSEHIIIPKGYYFVMGDNRSNSRDSRVDQIGLISADSIKGKAVFRLFPIGNFGILH